MPLARSALLSERLVAFPLLLDELLDTRVAGPLPEAQEMRDACAAALAIDDPEAALRALNDVQDAEAAFKALADENVNIKVIATSEIKISVLIDRRYMELAVQALHDAFELEKA